jgi:hypothetical protein
MGIAIKSLAAGVGLVGLVIGIKVWRHVRPRLIDLPDPYAV